jgi:curved DNA-binding protein CbpA
MSWVRLTKKQLIVLLFTLLVFGISTVFVAEKFGNGEPISAGEQTSQAASAPTDFLIEVYATIENNFWKDFSEQRLVGIFTQGVRRIATSSDVSADNKKELRAELERVIAEMSEKRQQIFPAELADLVMQSLPPQGRSRLYTQKKQKQLTKRVQNANSEQNLYDILGVSKSADTEDINQAYEKRKERLQTNPQSTSTREKRQQLNYAKDVLSDSDDRAQYKKTKSEPTVFAERISEDIVHLSINRYNRDTLQEFEDAVKSIDMESKPTSLILDLRSNLGGSIDVLPYLLGPFIGPDRVAYEFFQQGEEEMFRTKTGWMDALIPYKKVVVLVDGKTQSTGELMASVLKKFNVGTLVGETTRGWGTVERVFSLDNQHRSDTQYSLFLVNHLTLRPDGQPIQDRGITPDVSMRNARWRKQLRDYIPHDPLVRATEEVWNEPPSGTQVD